MWAYFCWLQISWVCRLTLKTMPSYPGLTPTLHSTIGLTVGSVEHSPLRQWKASRGGHLHFKKKTFAKCVNTFNNNYMRCLRFIWWHLSTLKWTGATLCTLTMDIMWPRSNDYFATHKTNRSRSNGFLPDVYQIWDEVIWLTPEKGRLISTAPICWEQTQPSPVSQQFNYND